MPSSRRPPLTSCKVAAITASVPASRLATLSTIGPIITSGTVAAMAEHPARITGEQGQEGELLGREVDAHVRDGHPVAGYVDVDVAHLEHGRVRLGRAPLPVVA